MTGEKYTFRPMALLVSIVTFVWLNGSALAGEIKVAVAANFTRTAQEIAARFEQDTGHKAVLILGSTGKLYAQIYHGAPYDVFLAADQKRPQQAQVEGLAVAGSRFTFAVGKIVLYSTNPDLIEGTPEVLTKNSFAKLAIGNPKTAPYGAAARDVLEKLNLYDKLAAKLVRGENISQTYQFVMTGNAQLGFVASSQVINTKSGSKWLIPENLYSPIKQDAVLLRHGAKNKAAIAFLHYLKSKKGRALIKKHGYGVED